MTGVNRNEQNNFASTGFVGVVGLTGAGQPSTKAEWAKAAAEFSLAAHFIEATDVSKRANTQASLENASKSSAADTFHGAFGSSTTDWRKAAAEYSVAVSSVGDSPIVAIPGTDQLVPQASLAAAALLVSQGSSMRGFSDAIIGSEWRSAVDAQSSSLGTGDYKNATTEIQWAFEGDAASQAAVLATAASMVTGSHTGPVAHFDGHGQ